jgi:hypothetical protein
VSGYVTETGTGNPLFAAIEFQGSPVIVYTDPATGYYQAEMAEGSYTMHVSAGLHSPVERAITVDQDQEQNFSLDPSPCVLLVDDDGNNPDVRSYSTQALDALGVDYDIWDVGTQGDPNTANLQNYPKILWYIGYPYNGTFTSANETAMAAYLDAGGNFFLSSQDYLYDMGLTAFGTNYLHIASFTSDVNQTSVTGQNIFSGLGPYSLSYPFTNYSDVVNPDGLAQLAFSGNMGNAAVSYDGANFNTVFLGYPLEAVSLAGRQAVLQRTLEFFGSCEPPIGWLDGHVTDSASGDPLEGALVTLLPGEGSLNGLTDPTGYYTMTLPAGDYIVSVSMDGYYPESGNATVTATQVTTLDFALDPQVCVPITNTDFTWLPITPTIGEAVTFTASAEGSAPISYAWDFGDGGGAGSPVNHTYNVAGDYTVILTATNTCSQDNAQHMVSVVPCRRKSPSCQAALT